MKNPLHHPSTFVRRAVLFGALAGIFVGTSPVIGQAIEAAVGAQSQHGVEPQVIDDLPANYAADLPPEQRSLIESGRYVARLGDGVACHTGNKCLTMAGGLVLATHFGQRY